ncbi:MAG: RraA family protein [Planctomycetota bacterium]
MSEKKPKPADPILDRFAGLRLTDVCDAMDAVGLQDVGLMDKNIRPLWRDIEQFAHRIVGRAHTVRFIPTPKRAPTFDNVEDYNKWKGHWYRQLAQGPIPENIQPGELIVIDAQDIPDCGFIGSNNSLQWMSEGAVGMVTNGGCRDTDELVKEQVPVYSAGISRGIRPGRLELESTQKPVTCGGVFVTPGDIVLADGDGVIVVPADMAEKVAEIAIDVQEGDKKGRRWFYDALGKQHDWTVKPREES